MKTKLIISACLLGVSCRYDGASKPIDGDKLRQLIEKFELIPVCPECMGGLETPRAPSERIGEKVMMNTGKDVTANYEKGAEETLRLAELFSCNAALLKERSPSCGSGSIYDGSFSGTLTHGDGVTAQLLKSRGITVYGESDIDKLLNLP